MHVEMHLRRIRGRPSGISVKYCLPQSLGPYQKIRAKKKEITASFRGAVISFGLGLTIIFFYIAFQRLLSAHVHS